MRYLCYLVLKTGDSIVLTLDKTHKLKPRDAE